MNYVTTKDYMDAHDLSCHQGSHWYPWGLTDLIKVLVTPRSQMLMVTSDSELWPESQV